MVVVSDIGVVCCFYKSSNDGPSIKWLYYVKYDTVHNTCCWLSDILFDDKDWWNIYFVEEEDV